MKSALKRLLAGILLAAAIFVLPALATESGVSSITTGGALVLSLSSRDMREAGFELGDIVKVSVGDVTEDVPYCKSYGEVLIGRPLMYQSGGTVYLSCSYGHYALERGLAEWNGTSWQLRDGKDLSSLRVTLEMAQKGGYLDTRISLKLNDATNTRSDYGSDEIFANFREVRGGRLGFGTLYRSSIPSSSTRPRAPYADALAREAGIKTVLNLANSPERLKKNMDAPECKNFYYRSLYESGSVIARSLPVTVNESAFRKGLADELRFAIAHDGPYLVHCAEGKDRTGFVCFLLAALMDASPKELERDYGESFINYYHVSRDDPRYWLHVNDGLAYFYRSIGGRGAFAESGNLSALAREWLRGIGLTDDEISILEESLALNSR